MNLWLSKLMASMSPQSSPEVYEKPSCSRTKAPSPRVRPELFALEGSAFALVQVLLYARLAAQDRRAVLAVWGALAVLAVIVVGWRHNSVAEIVTSVVAVSLALTVVGFILDRRQATKVDSPIEAAE